MRRLSPSIPVTIQGTDRAERVEVLQPHAVAAPDVGGGHAGRAHVVDARVAEDVIERVFRSNLAGAFADHDADLGLVDYCVADARIDYRLVVRDDGSGLLGEESGAVASGLLAVVRGGGHDLA